MSDTSLDELAAEFQRRYATLKATPKSAGDPGARALDAIQSGVGLVALKPYKFDGRHYQPGDNFAPPPAYAARVAQMATHGFVCSEPEYRRSQEAAGAKYYRDEIANGMARINGMRSARARAIARRAELTAELAGAEIELSNLDGEIAGAELELRKIIQGPELSGIMD